MPGTMPNANQSDLGGNGILNSSEPAPPPREHYSRYETDLSSVLAFAPREIPLEILQIADERARNYCSQLGLDAGDRITRHDGLKDDVLLSLEDGRRVRLALAFALVIEVEPALRS